ncbi:MAG: HDOD domain-containing protein [Cellvibrionaceae bacterium]
MSVELTQDQIKELLQGITIPPQPQIMVDLQMEQLNPSPDIEAITKLISQDMGLAGSILKTVNSAFYGLTNKISSIAQAVQLMGVNSVINLTNALSIRGELSDEDIVTLGKFWDAAMDIAMVSAHIAKQIGYHSPDEAYTLGLFHHCSIPLLMKRFKNYQDVAKQAYEAEKPRIVDLENEVLLTNHAVVGYYIGKSWKLPSYICEAIHDHHSIHKVFAEGNTEDNNKKTLLAILKMAEHICGNYRIIGQQDVDNEWNDISEAILLYTGLSQYDFEGIIEQVHEQGLGYN